MSMFVVTDPSPGEHNSAKPQPAPPSASFVSEMSRYTRGKFVLDLVTAGLLLLLTSPLILLAMVLVKITSRGPAIYSQTRVGRNGVPFTIYKIRTMNHGCESLTGAQWSKPGDGRVTPVGRGLRRCHLDELPQLWNVLRGDMSLIGPRPERPEFLPHLERAIPCYRHRLRVRPGVTGLAQVQLPPDSDLESVRSKIAYDLHYVAHLQFLLDLRIYGATFCKMFGVPFSVIRVLFRFPLRAMIEFEYAAQSERCSEAKENGEVVKLQMPQPALRNC